MTTNPIIQMLMTRLQKQNPQGYQVVNEAMQNNGNPQSILQQMMTNATPEQKESLFKQARQYGVPNDILSKIQNMK